MVYYLFWLTIPAIFIFTRYSLVSAMTMFVFLLSNLASEISPTFSDRADLKFGIIMQI